MRILLTSCSKSSRLRPLFRFQFCWITCPQLQFTRPFDYVMAETHVSQLCITHKSAMSSLKRIWENWNLTAWYYRPLVFAWILCLFTPHSMERWHRLPCFLLSILWLHSNSLILERLHFIWSFPWSSLVSAQSAWRSKTGQGMCLSMHTPLWFKFGQSWSQLAKSAANRKSTRKKIPTSFNRRTDQEILTWQIEISIFIALVRSRMFQVLKFKVKSSQKTFTSLKRERKMAIILGVH